MCVGALVSGGGGGKRGWGRRAALAEGRSVGGGFPGGHFKQLTIMPGCVSRILKRYPKIEHINIHRDPKKIKCKKKKYPKQYSKMHKSIPKHTVSPCI